MVEGFRIVPDARRGYILECCFENEDTEGFIPDITLALAELDRVLRENRCPPRETGLRLKPHYKR